MLLYIDYRPRVFVLLRTDIAQRRKLNFENRDPYSLPVLQTRRFTLRYRIKFQSNQWPTSRIVRLSSKRQMNLVLLSNIGLPEKYYLSFFAVESNNVSSRSDILSNRQYFSVFSDDLIVFFSVMTRPTLMS